MPIPGGGKLITKNMAIKLSEPVEEAYMAAVDRLIVNIAKHLGGGTAIRTATWETLKLQELGRLTAENAKIINEATKGIPEEIRLALDEASREALSTLEKAIEEAIKEGRLEKSPIDTVQEMLQELGQQAVEQANLVNTVMLESCRSSYLQAVQNTVTWVEEAMTAQQLKEAQDILNTATAAVEIGADTRREALRKAISQMADNGIYGFVDRAGRHWSPEAYMNMDIRTTVHNAAIQSIRNRQQEYNSDIFQISTHPGARPLCYPYQGKFYSWGSQGGTFTDGAGHRHSYKPIGSTSYGQAAGIFGINCGHYPIPQIAGVTIPQDKVEQNKAENDKQYQESQQQRALERSIREAKRKQAAFSAAGLDDAAKEMDLTIKDRQAKMRAFIKETGRSRRYDREQIK